MSLIRNLTLFSMLSIAALNAPANAATNQPGIGYLYPAGGQQGTTVNVIAGGQFLKGANDVYITGEGVTAKVIKYYRPEIRLKKDQRQYLQKLLLKASEKQFEKTTANTRPQKTGKNRSQKAGSKKIAKPAAKPKKEQPQAFPENFKIPEHPILYDMENKSLRELQHITKILFAPISMQQPNRQLAENVLIEITIAPDAEPGIRQLRMSAGQGLTNPINFQISMLPEKYELEPNDQMAYPPIQKYPNLKKPKPLNLPVTLNGQITPGDMDRFRFYAKEGQQLVIETQARSLIPYLADAVPGWFQATVALYNSSGKEVAYADDYSFNPDPVLFYKIARTGEYELQIRDSIYRGREDFVYRVAIGEIPFITQMFPLGAKEGSITDASIDGWNLAVTQLSLDTQPAAKTIRYARHYDSKSVSNSMPYAVGTVAENDESESNDTIADAQRIVMPIVINGRVDKPGDVDVFKFTGRAGDKITAEVFARRLNSPLDSLLRLTDASGKILQFNDDNMVKQSHLHKDIVGLQTHHADSYLTAELPKNGTYCIHLSDAQHHGSKAHSYRLRVWPPQMDFALRVTPSTLSMLAGATIPLTVHAMRKDGFDGEINVSLAGKTNGFKLSGNRIPSGCERIRMTITAPTKPLGKPAVLQFLGTAKVGTQTITRPAVPAEDMMQAFLYRHLVPSQNMLADAKKTKKIYPNLKVTNSLPIKIAAGSSTRVNIKTPKHRKTGHFMFELNKPPKGITLEDFSATQNGVSLNIKADSQQVKAGFRDNLIIEVFTEYTPKKQEGKPAPKKRKVPLVTLPAIPIKIIAQ